MTAPRFLILADGDFGPMTSKTANSCIRYFPERIVAFVVPAAGARIDEDALDRRCLDAIARHKRPKQYRVVDELPRNAAGKVLKKQLREMAGVADA